MIKTVGELIDILQKHPRDQVVLRGDNSGGYESISEVKEENAEEIATKNKTQVLVLE